PGMNRMLTESKACPSSQVLSEFRRGQLPDMDLQILADHVGSCASCSTEMSRLTDDDALLSRLKQSLRQTPLPEEEACLTLAARARAIWGEDPDLTGDMRPSRSKLPIPRFLGAYEVLEPLNGGGMGDIYKARHTRLKRLVALKTLTADRASDPSAI